MKFLRLQNLQREAKKKLQMRQLYCKQVSLYQPMKSRLSPSKAQCLKRKLFGPLIKTEDKTRNDTQDGINSSHGFKYRAGELTWIPVLGEKCRLTKSFTLWFSSAEELGFNKSVHRKHKRALVVRVWENHYLFHFLFVKPLNILPRSATIG